LFSSHCAVIRVGLIIRIIHLWKLKAAFGPGEPLLESGIIGILV
jgi:hypothetical protein